MPRGAPAEPAACLTQWRGNEVHHRLSSIHLIPRRRGPGPGQTPALPGPLDRRLSRPGPGPRGGCFQALDGTHRFGCGAASRAAPLGLRPSAAGRVLHGRGAGGRRARRGGQPQTPPRPGRAEGVHFPTGGAAAGRRHAHEVVVGERGAHEAPAGKVATHPMHPWVGTPALDGDQRLLAAGTAREGAGVEWCRRRRRAGLAA